LPTLTFDSGIVILDSERNQILAYIESAAIVWRALKGGAQASAAAEALSQTYGISPAQGLADAAAIIDHWTRVGLLDGSPSALPPAEKIIPPPAPETGPEQIVTFSIRGNYFRTTIAEMSVAKHLKSLLASFIVDSPPAKCDGAVFNFTVSIKQNVMQFCVDGVECACCGSPAEMIAAVLHAMMERVYGHPSWLAILHSAAIIRDNKSLLLAGVSGSGKSTLSAYLCANGYSYASDDLAALIAPVGLVAPWPVPRSLKQGSWQVLSAVIPELENIASKTTAKGEIKYLPAPSEAWHQEPCPVAALLFPTYDRNAPSEFVRLRPLEALQRLLEDNVWLGFSLERGRVENFLSWLECTPAYAIRYNDLNVARALIDDHVF
jgi:hypothetical protein